MPALTIMFPYKTYILKSRHELAWARFFQRNGFLWEYEPIQFYDGNAVYTPDFALNGRRVFVEIKTDRAKRLNLFHLCPSPLLIIFGLPNHCYIRFKPALANRPIPVRMTTWDAAVDMANTYDNRGTYRPA